MAGLEIGNGVAAHRGAWGWYAENTLDAFEEALRLGCDWLELDIRASADGRLVVTHDPTTGRLSAEDIPVDEATFEALRRLAVASAGGGPAGRMPALEEVFALLRRSGGRATIQPKAHGLVEPALGLARAAGVWEQIAFNEGSCEPLVEVKRRAPEVPVLWDRPAASDLETNLWVARTFGFEALVYEHVGLADAVVRRVQEAGLVCGACVVNDAPSMDRLRALGVRLMYTDAPSLLLQRA